MQEQRLARDYEHVPSCAESRIFWGSRGIIPITILQSYRQG
jgi:hypothetical protein